MAVERSMDVGKFYWVKVRSSKTEPNWQPARFTGMAGDSIGMTWDFIGFNSDVGHHFVEVLEVGGKIDGADALYGSS